MKKRGTFLSFKSIPSEKCQIGINIPSEKRQNKVKIPSKNVWQFFPSPFPSLFFLQKEKKGRKELRKEIFFFSLSYSFFFPILRKKEVKKRIEKRISLLFFFLFPSFKEERNKEKRK